MSEESELDKLHFQPNFDLPKIVLRIGVDEDGYLIAYDLLTGRVVHGQKAIVVEQPDPEEDLQTVNLRFWSDPRICTPRALDLLEHENADTLTTNW